MVLYTEAQARNAIQQLKDVPAYTEILTLVQGAPQPSQSAEPEPSPQEIAGQSLLDTSVIPSENREGPEMESFADLRELDIDTNEMYGLSNMEDLKRIMLYLKQYCRLTPKAVQARGACMMASVRRCAAVPYEYTNLHLRRQIVVFICNMAEYLFPMLQVHIKGNYGHARLSRSQLRRKEREGTLTPQERSDYNEPGPFSLVSYLEGFLDRGFYGDEITLVVMSMMWQLRITVLQAETQIQTKICHSNTLARTDMVLVRTSWLHYFPASKSFFFFFSSISSLSAMLVMVAPRWMQMHHVGCVCATLVVPHHNWSFSFVFPVKENVITTEDGESLIERDLVKAAPLVKSPGYSLQNEDPSVYSDGEDFDSFCPDREWPDEELVNQPAPASTSQPTQPSSPTLTASDSQVKKLLESHHLQVEVLKSIGIDPCLEYQRGQATFHLTKVRKGDVTCPLCSQKCANTQKLRNLIRARHQEVTAFRCSMCHKSFGDSYSLKVHQEGHRKSVQSKYRCRLCKKGIRYGQSSIAAQGRPRLSGCLMPVLWQEVGTSQIYPVT